MFVRLTNSDGPEESDREVPLEASQTNEIPMLPRNERVSGNRRHPLVHAIRWAVLSIFQNLTGQKCRSTVTPAPRSPRVHGPWFQRLSSRIPASKPSRV